MSSYTYHENADLQPPKDCRLTVFGAFRNMPLTSTLPS